MVVFDQRVVLEAVEMMMHGASVSVSECHADTASNSESKNNYYRYSSHQMTSMGFWNEVSAFPRA
jgi:hypothetical protein